MLMVAVLIMFASCNSSSEDDPGTVTVNAVNVSSFSLKADSKILSGLDNVYFSIDLKKGIIFNADSLPKGTRVTDLIPVISYGSAVTGAVITMEGGQKRQGEINYISTQTDSVDFTGRVFLKLTSAEGNYMRYELKVNVHKMEPDSLWWGKTSISKLPSRLESPKSQKTVMYKDKVTSLIQESNDTYTLSQALEPSVDQWTKEESEFKFTPDIRSLTATDDALYILATDGTLYTSQDGLTWDSTSRHWDNIIGGYASTLLGIKTVNGQRVHTGYPSGMVTESAIDPRFPIKEYSNLHCMTSIWSDVPTGILVGGIDGNGEISSRVWGYDGNEWVLLSEGEIPPLRGATLIPYFAYRNTSSTTWNFKEYSVLMLTGGIASDGTFNRSLYLSYNNGVVWKLGSEYMQLPDNIPGMWNCDNVIASTSLSSNIEPKGWTSVVDGNVPRWYKVNYTLDGYNIEWECPYIYLFGGEKTDHTLYNTIWRGVINRLTFAPLI